MEFAGLAAPLSPQCLEHIAGTLGADLASIWAVLSVETAGCGYLSDRRTQILFERHKFHKFTEGLFDDVAPDLSNPASGGYGEAGAGQYQRLERAIALNETAALMSTSWGLGQIMGFNATNVGFADAKEMVEAFARSEDQQIGAMSAFIVRNGLAAALRDHDWQTFAAGYNGAGFARHGYHEKLEMFQARYAIGPLPDLMVRAVQMALTFIGIPKVGTVDGWYGQRTQIALLEFQRSAALPTSGRPDDVTVAALIGRAGW